MRLPVIGFGALVAGLVLAPTAAASRRRDAPRRHRRDQRRRQYPDAANALLPIPAVTATAQARLRAAWTVDFHAGAGGRAAARGRDGSTWAAGRAVRRRCGDVLQAVPPEVRAGGAEPVEGRWCERGRALTLPDRSRPCAGRSTRRGHRRRASIWLVCAGRPAARHQGAPFWFQAAVGPDEGLPGAPTGALRGRRGRAGLDSGWRWPGDSWNPAAGGVIAGESFDAFLA
jgi:hypothetical protein